jgi:hypothetical protein
VRVGDKILFLSELGELLVFPAIPTAFKPLYMQQVLGRGRTHFTLSGNILFLRDDRMLNSSRKISLRVFEAPQTKGNMEAEGTKDFIFCNPE